MGKKPPRRNDPGSASDTTPLMADCLTFQSITNGQAPIIASAPLSIEAYGASILPAAQYRLDQRLLGFEAQLNAFSHILDRDGQTLNLAPLPEMLPPGAPPVGTHARSDWSSNQSTAGQRAGDAPRLAPIHLRFGPVRYARVIKGARNVAILADDPVTPSTEDTADLPGSDICLPATFSAVFAYDTRRAGPIEAGFGADRHKLTAQPLPPECHHADLDAEAQAGRPAPLPVRPTPYVFPGLTVCSLAEYRRVTWEQAGGLADPSHAYDWRRALATHPPAPNHPAGFILLPWNLANPASIVPDLVKKLLVWEAGAAPLCRIVLYPFNTTPLGRHTIETLVTDLQARDDIRPGLSNLFVAKLHALRHAFDLPKICPLAWIEAQDPESAWTARRLAYLGLQSILLRDQAPSAGAAIACDQRLAIHRSDCFGPRTYEVRTLSPRRLSQLLAQSDAARTAAPARAVHYA